MADIALRPSYWASVSGGKDSLYMLNLILHNPNKYPLDGVVHFELEVDYPFIHNVIDYMEAECKRTKSVCLTDAGTVSDRSAVKCQTKLGG